MAIRTFDEITSRDRKLVSMADVDEIGSRDLRGAAEEHLSAHPVVEHLLAGAFNAEGVEVVWFPESGRAGVAWGGGADWTDASSADDALRRYFGVDGAEMVP